MSAGHPHTRSYWDGRASRHLGTAGEAAAVCDEGQLVGAGDVPPMEERGARLVAAHLPAGGRTLEVGCGYGRWFDRFGPDRRLIGMDFSRVMGRRAATRPAGVPVLLGDARALPIAAGSLDAAYTMKVLQFLPAPDRPAAVAGMLRSVRTGGTVVLYEKTAPPDGSPADDWIAWGERAGGRLVRWYGNQFTPVDRALARLARTLRPGGPAVNGDGVAAGAGGPTRRDRHPRLFRAYRALQRLELRLFLPAEPLLEWAAPARWAEHGVFVFERTGPP